MACLSQAKVLRDGLSTAPCGLRSIPPQDERLSFTSVRPEEQSRPQAERVSKDAGLARHVPPSQTCRKAPA